MIERDAGRALPTRSEGAFYVWMALLIAGVVGIGFGPTLDNKLLHPQVPRPAILYAHSVVFGAWLVLFAVQAALIRTRRLRWHRRLGTFGAGLGILMPLLGIATAISIIRAHVVQIDDASDKAFLIVSLFDMVCFAVVFVLAVAWRRRPDRHRRLMFIATCTLTGAAFARFPAWLVPDNAFYAGVDALILIGALRDSVQTGRPHATYSIALPLLVAGQLLVMWIYLSAPPGWVRIAAWILHVPRA